MLYGSTNRGNEISKILASCWFFYSIFFPDQQPKYMIIRQYISSNIPCLKYFQNQTLNMQNGTNALKDLSLAILLLHCMYVYMNLMS